MNATHCLLQPSRPIILTSLSLKCGRTCRGRKSPSTDSPASQKPLLNCRVYLKTTAGAPSSNTSTGIVRAFPPAQYADVPETLQQLKTNQRLSAAVIHEIKLLSWRPGAHPLAPPQKALQQACQAQDLPSNKQASQDKLPRLDKKSLIPSKPGPLCLLFSASSPISVRFWALTLTLCAPSLSLHHMICTVSSCTPSSSHTTTQSNSNYWRRQLTATANNPIRNLNPTSPCILYSPHPSQNVPQQLSYASSSANTLAHAQVY